MEELAQHEQQCHTKTLVAAACRLAATRNDVRSIRIVPGVRPTYTELAIYQEWAHDCQVRLTVDGKGMIAVRPARAGKE